MKKQIIVALALSFSLYTFAQKKELKALDKAIEKQDIATAKSIMPTLDGLVGNMDAKQKDKYYMLKAMMLMEEAGKTEDEAKFLQAVKLFDKLSSEGQKKAAFIKQGIENEILTEANNSYTNGDFKDASSGFAMLYELSKDGEYLYYASQSALQAKDYDAALGYFETLKEIGYTGEEMQYYAVNKISGEEELLDKTTRDNYIKLGTHIKATERQSESREAEVVKMQLTMLELKILMTLI